MAPRRTERTRSNSRFHSTVFSRASILTSFRLSVLRECEVLHRTHFRTRLEARCAIFAWIEGWYNTHRRHSALGYLSPRDFESRYIAQRARP